MLVPPPRAVSRPRAPPRTTANARAVAGLGLGCYTFPAAQVIGHHGVWGAFAFWSPELDAVITGTVNTGRVDRRPLLGAIVRALIG